MKGKLLKKLKSIRPVGYLKQDRVLQIKTLNGYVESLAHNLIVSRENEPKEVDDCVSVKKPEPEVIDVSDHMRDMEDEEMEFDEDNDNKENIGPSSLQKSKHPETSTSTSASRLSEPRADDDYHRQTPLSEIDISSFRRPDMNSDSLFDPNLLVAFEEAVKEHLKMTEAERNDGFRFEEASIEKNEEETDPWILLEEKCPRGGSESVILYTTTLRGIRKTFEDCNSVRFLLESFKVVYVERDISMHMEFKEELWKILDGKTLPPRLFVKGRYIGGAEEVLTLHEQGKLRPLFTEIPVNNSNSPCEGCDGVRFVICFHCNGSKRVIGEDEQRNQCPDCNENGVIICPYCS